MLTAAVMLIITLLALALFLGAGLDETSGPFDQEKS